MLWPTSAQRCNANGRLQVKASLQAVARHFAASEHTISTLWARYNTTQGVNDRARSSCYRVTFVAQDRYIRVRHLRNRTTTKYPWTVHNLWPKEAGISPRRPVRCNVLTPTSLGGARRGWDGHVPGGGLFYSQMSLVFSCHMLMDAHVSTDVEGNVMLQSATHRLFWCWECHGVDRNPWW